VHAYLETERADVLSHGHLREAIKAFYIEMHVSHEDDIEPAVKLYLCQILDLLSENFSQVSATRLTDTRNLVLYLADRYLCVTTCFEQLRI
jgi:hypothetical protein